MLLRYEPSASSSVAAGAASVIDSGQVASVRGMWQRRASLDVQPDPKKGGVGPPKAGFEMRPVGERRGSIGGGSGQQQQQQQQQQQPVQLEGGDRIRFLVQVHCTHVTAAAFVTRHTLLLQALSDGSKNAAAAMELQSMALDSGNQVKCCGCAAAHV